MIVGIDLGTTNSLVAVMQDGKPFVIPNSLGKNLTPSVVSIDEEGNTFIGETAKERMITHPDESAAVFKRSMGTNKVFKLGKREFKAEELSSLVLKSLKADAESYLGQEITEAVISVPAYFNDAQRKATKRAGELAGLKVERIISEPTAAAVAYGLNQKDADTKFLVFDLGGGTFDISIIELFDNIMEVNAVAGDNYLGGEDFTEVLVNMFLNEMEIDKDKLSRKEMSRLKKSAELCKIGFSENRVSSIKVKLGEDIYDFEVDIDEYEEACQPLLAKLRKPIERSLKDANVKLKDISEIVLVGGATKLPIIMLFVCKLFGRVPSAGINPDEVVAQGAAMQAAMKERNEDVKEMILTDVCPFTLGTEVCEIRNGIKEGGHYLPIIERNTVIPVSRTHRVYTASDNQDKLSIPVFQGESRFTINNVLLGKLTIPVPRGPEGKEAADITFTYDVNSILEVIVTVVSTQLSKRLVIKNEEVDMTDEEIDERLKSLDALKIHPREKEENKLLLLRGDRMYEEAVGEARRLIQMKLADFEAVLDKQNKADIERAAEDLKLFLDTIADADDM